MGYIVRIHGMDGKEDFRIMGQVVLQTFSCGVNHSKDSLPVPVRRFFDSIVTNYGCLPHCKDKNFIGELQAIALPVNDSGLVWERAHPNGVLWERVYLKEFVSQHCAEEFMRSIADQCVSMRPARQFSLLERKLGGIDTSASHAKEADKTILAKNLG